MNVQSEILINKPVDKVADFAANPDNASQWYFNIESVKWKTPRPLAVGSQIVFKAQFLRRKRIYIYVITEYIPGQKLVMQTAEAPFPVQTTYTWRKETNDQTRMSLHNNGHLGGVLKLFSPFIKTMMRKENNRDLKKIKQILES